MKYTISIYLLALGALVPWCGAKPWQSTRLTADFYAEGATAGDIDGDGAVDLVYGPQWWAGPTFEEHYRFTPAPAEPFIADRGYSDNFFSYVVDADGDGDNDILVYGFPGKEARLYLNPGSARSNLDWKMKLVAPEISNESPHFYDLVPGGLPEIVCTKANQYGYYEAGEDPTAEWIWRGISDKGLAGGRFEHGLGIGDVNRDGRPDILQREFWFENSEGTDFWTKRRWALPPQPGGAQILVDDLDGDGDSDIITSLRAHGFGLAWFEQYEPGKFVPHSIMGESSTDNPFGVCFSQHHALALADIDGDGRNDFVTGKRYLAHQGKDPGGLEAPVLYWFRNTLNGDEIEFVPHLVDSDSGVGVEVKVLDLNDDGRLDIISGNKKGLAIHLQTAGDLYSTAAERWRHPEGRSQDGYGSGQTVEQALAGMEIPEGFFVDLIGSEPEVTQPIAMTFDSRGRIWVIEGHTYPERSQGGYSEGKDRVVIFEDTNGDGSFDSKKMFIENVNLASGIEVGFGGVYIGAAPYLLFYPDRNEDDKPDGEPEILLDGWGYQDTHETLNAFTWGPDGWLYGCQGVFTHSKVGKPGTPEEQRIPMNAGVWRFHPDSRDFQVFAHGTSNPWGVDFNEVGDWFISACVIPHFYHLSRGGLYQRQAGQHFNPWAFDDIKTIADHAHYAGNLRDHAFWGANKAARPKAPNDTSVLGGGHAHCGLALYLADTFPPQYRGDAFFHNLHGHRIVREDLEKKGSGYVARHRPDFLFANDHDFVGVGVMLGPDGALYYSDWVDPQTCHHRDVEIWDRANGRIYRVRYGDRQSTRVDLPGKTDAELVSLLGDGNAFIARQSQKLLQERAVGGTLEKEETERALADFESQHAEDVPLRLRAFWTRHVTGLLSGEKMMAAFGDESEHVRGWAVQLAVPNEGTIPRMEAMAKDEPSLWVRRHLASKLQELPVESRWTLAENLITHGRSGFDSNIPLLCWYGIEPLVELDSERAFALSNRTRWPQLKDFIARRAVVTPKGREALLTTLSRTGNAQEFARRSGELLASLAKMPPVEQPSSWPAAKAQGEKLGQSNKPIMTTLSQLGARLGDADFFPRWREVALDQKEKVSRRKEAVDLLIAGKDPELGRIGRTLLENPSMHSAAIGALRTAPSVETAEAIVAKIGKFPLKLRNESINLLASRPEMALVLLGAVDRDEVEASLVSPVMLNQFDLFENREIDSLISKNWTRGGDGVDLAQLHSSIEGWKKKLNSKVMAKADASRGRVAYNITCGTCHQMFGEGIALGPDLTGSNRSDLGYILENVLAPSSVVGTDYLLNIFTMRDGSTVSGMIRKETPDFFSISMPGGALIDVKKTDVENRQEMAQSLMPAGLFDALPLETVADLVKYLAVDRQVPLPGEKPEPSVSPLENGVEAEALTAKYRPASGVATVQKMTGFGPDWSGDAQLFWRGGKPGDIYTLKLDGLKPGTIELTIVPTTAKDYATIKLAINGQLREVDLYTEKVSIGEPIVFKGVNISPREPLQIDIHITGQNEAALEGRYFVGLDRFEVSRSEEEKAQR